MPIDAISDTTFDVVSLDQFKAHLRIDHDDQDDLLEGCLASGLTQCEALVQRRYQRRQFRWVINAWPLDFVIPIAPVDRSNVAITYRDSAAAQQAISADDIVVAPCAGGGARIVAKPGFAWPCLGDHAERVVVTFYAGFADAAAVPPLVKTAVMVAAAQLFHMPEGGGSALDASVPANVAGLLLSEHWFP